MDSSYWSAILAQLAAQTPLWCALFAGLVTAGVFWGRWPRPALLVLLATVLYGLLTAVQSPSFLWLTHLQATHFWSMKEVGLRSLVMSVTFSLLHAVVYALLLTAAFVGRRPAASVPPPLPVTPSIL